MASKSYDESDGVWRTIGGRRVFIRNGQSLSDAMKESGKFGKKKQSEIAKEEKEKWQKQLEHEKEIENDESQSKEIREFAKRQAEGTQKEADRYKKYEEHFSSKEKSSEKENLIGEYNKRTERGSMDDDSFTEKAREQGMSDENIAKEIYKKHNGPEANNSTDDNIKRLLAKQRKEEALSQNDQRTADIFEKYERKYEERINQKKNNNDEITKKKEFNYLSEDEKYESKQFNDMSDTFQKNLESKYGKQQAEKINKSAEEYVQNKGAAKINKALREDSVEKLKNKQGIKDAIDNIDKAINSYQTDQDIKTVRFEDGTNLLKHYGVDLNKFDKSGNIDMIPKSKLAEELKKNIGSEYSSKAFMSVSGTKTGSPGFTNLPVRMEIDVPKGTNAFITKNTDEKEIILNRNQKMILKGVEYEPWSSSLLGSVNPEVADKRGKVVLKYEIQNVGSSSDKAYKNAFEQYKKKHPNSKINLNQFIDMSEGK